MYVYVCMYVRRARAWTPLSRKRDNSSVSSHVLAETIPDFSTRARGDPLVCRGLDTQTGYEVRCGTTPRTDRGGPRYSFDSADIWLSEFVKG